MAKYKLGDICEIVSGSTPKSEVAEYWDGDIKWITPAELNEDSYIISDSVRKITQLGVQKTGLTPFPAGTVILSSRAPIGKVAIAGCEMYCNQGFKNLICSSVIDSRYLYWFLKGKTAFLNSLGRGATFKEISKQIVASIEIEVPPIEQQIAIVQMLERINEIMKGRKQELLTLDTLIKARFVEMFESTESRRSTFRKEFEFISRGKTPTYVDSSNLEVINQACIYWDGIVFSKVKYNDESYNGDRILKYGDVIINSTGTGTLGRASVFVPRDSSVRYMVDSHVTILRGGACSPIYIKYYLEQEKVQSEIYRKCVSGSTNQIELSKEKLGMLELLVPPYNLQNDFATFVSQVDKSKVVVQKALDEAQLLFDSLMQKYFG